MKRLLLPMFALFALSFFSMPLESQARVKKFKGGAVIADAYFCRIVNGRVVAKKRLPYMIMYGKSPWCNANPHNCYRVGMDFIKKGRTKVGGAEARKLAAKALLKTGVSCAKGFATGRPEVAAAKCGFQVAKNLIVYQFKTKTCVRGHHAFCAAKYPGWVACDPNARGAAQVYRSNKRACFWFGTAPFCKGSAGMCRSRNMVAVRYSKRGDGKKCSSGRKVLCCTKPGAGGAHNTNRTRRCSTRQNYDRKGGDFRKIKGKRWSLGQCRGACQRDPRCLAYTYHYKGKKRGNCYLKSSVKKLKRNNNAYTGTCR